MKPLKRRDKKKKSSRRDVPAQPATGERGTATEERSGYGILPDRDLKKNLGCG